MKSQKTTKVPTIEHWMRVASIWGVSILIVMVIIAGIIVWFPTSDNHLRYLRDETPDIHIDSITIYVQDVGNNIGLYYNSEDLENEL